MVAPMPPRAVGLVVIALLCFAGNSILCRLALAAREIDAATFTSIRLLAGALVLSLFALRRARPKKHSAWASALALFAYAAPFSFAYLEIGAAVGALALFGTVQATMIGWGLARGERPTALAWLGIALAVAGLVTLTLPGASAPNLFGTLAMVGAGVAWAAYTLLGRAVVGDPVVATSMSFSRAVPLAALLFAVAFAVSGFHASPKGVVLAALSGAVTSGLGYSIWYAALAYLSRMQAAVLQLTVPILAAVAAVVLLGESVSARLAVASVAILGGVALTFRGSA
jgi:drug/metabolite transporter (DMT)-like permease